MSKLLIFIADNIDVLYFYMRLGSYLHRREQPNYIALIYYFVSVVDKIARASGNDSEYDFTSEFFLKASTQW